LQRLWLLLPIGGDPPEQQPAASFSGGDNGEATATRQTTEIVAMHERRSPSARCAPSRVKPEALSGRADAPNLRARATFGTIKLAPQLLGETFEQRVHPWPERLVNCGPPHLPPVDQGAAEQ
jgi:hypothetical protein